MAETDSVAGISFDLTLEEGGISTAISDVSEQVKEQLEQTFQNAADRIENSVSEIQQSIGDIDVDIDTSGINQAVNETENVADELQNKINEILANTELSASSKAMRISGIYKKQGLEQSEAMKKAWAQIERTSNKSTDTTNRNVSNSYSKLTDNIRDKFKNLQKNISAFAQSISQKFKGLKKNISPFTQSISQKFKMSLTDIKSGFDMVLGSIRSIISNSKGLMSIYQTQIEAEARLGATMRNSTGATEEQIQSVKDLASELQGLGVVGDEVQLAGAQELATYVSTTDSIKTMLPVLDDMIAQQYGYSASTDSAVTIATMLGKVLQGQTSALSRYGYSFTKAQEKILKYGTEQERVATLAEVVNESVSGVNKALADTPTGKVKQLSNDFGDLQETLGSIITNVFSPIAKLLDKIIIKLNTALSIANQYVKQMLGIQDSNISLGGLAENADDTTDAVDDTTDSVKKLKKATAGFDQLNILSSDKSDDTTTDGSSESLAVDIDTSGSESSIDTIDDSIENLKKKLQSLGEIPVFKTISDIFKDISVHARNVYDSIIQWATGIDLTPLINGFNSILEPIENIVNNCLEGLELFVADFVEPTASWAIEEAVPKAFETIADALKLCNEFGEETYDTLSLLKEEILDPIAEWTSDLIVSAIDAIRDAINTTGEKLLNLWEAVKPFVDWLIKVLKPAVMGVLAFIQGLLEGLWEMIKGIVDGIIDVLTGIIKFITGVFENDWTKAWEGIKQIFAGLFEALWGIVEGACKIIAGIIKGLLDILLSAVKIIWDSIAYACQCIWNVIKGIINLIIDGINLLWQGIYGVVKGIVDSVGGIAGALGDLFGQDWHFNMPQQPPLIPKLAKGGLATSPTLALVGDNKNAKSDPEVIAPLSKLKQMIVPPTIKALSGNGNYNSESSVKEKSSNNSEIIMMLSKMYELIRNQEEQYINNIYLDSEKIESKSVKIRKRKARRYNNV